MTVQAPARPNPKLGEPTWEVAELFPVQGYWSVHEYLSLTERTRRPIELVDGYLEILPMPKFKHQRISRYLFHILEAFAKIIGGDVYYSPLPMFIGPVHYREPDLLFFVSANDPRTQGDYPTGADLVIEIVSPDDKSHERDYVEKRSAYAQARVLEYWIVDPQDERITVLHLKDDQYFEHGVFARGAVATSLLLPALQVNVDAALDAK